MGDRRLATMAPVLEWAVALAVTSFLIALHINFFISAGPFWRDEVNSIEMAARPSLQDLWASLGHDSFPALYSLVLRAWAWIGAGGSDLGFRVLGLLVGLALVATQWFNAWKLSRAVPIVSLVLFAVNPLVILVGDSLRPYGLGTLLIVLTFTLVGRMLIQPTKGNVILAAVLAVLSVQCLYTNAVLLLAIGLSAAIVAARNAEWNKVLVVLGIGLAAAISLLPYLGPIRQAQDWLSILQMPTDFALMRQTFFEALSTPGFTLLLGNPVSFAWQALYCLGLPAAGLVLLLHRAMLTRIQRDLVLFSVLVVLTGTAGSLLFLKQARVAPQPWYFLPLMGLAAAAFDVLLNRLITSKDGRLLQVVLAACAFALVAQPIYQHSSRRQTNIDLVAAIVSDGAAKEDLVLVDPWFYGVSFQRYYDGPAPWTTLPPLADHTIHRYDLLKQSILSPPPVAPLTEAMSRTLRSGNRVWVVGALPEEGELPPLGSPPSATGWHCEDYLNVWRLHLGAFIRDHAVRVETFMPPFDGPTNPYETVTVHVIQGWRP